MIKPLLHRVLLKLDSSETITPSGIVIPDEVIKKERKAVEIGTVMDIGPTAFRDYGGDENTIKIGDRVVIARYSGKEVKDGDIDFVVVNDEDLICKLGE